MVRRIRILCLVLLFAATSLLLYEMKGLTAQRRFDHQRTVDQLVYSNQGNMPQRHVIDNIDSGDVWKEKRLSCWIMTSPANLETRAKYIKETWAKRCDRAVFISSETNTSFPTVAVDAKEGRHRLAEKTLRGYHYVALRHLHDCDWFLKADDDTYVIVDNLRYFLADKNSSEPVYYGHMFTSDLTPEHDVYASGGAGIVASKEAMRRFAKGGLDSRVCRQKGTYGDAAFGDCLRRLHVRRGDSTDSRGRSRFHAFAPEDHVMGAYPEWYYERDVTGAKKGTSDYPISFHYVRGQTQLLLDFYFFSSKVHHEDNPDE